MTIETIYMPLADEGTDVWRPVQAEQLAVGRYRVIGPMPEDEFWQFLPGSFVSTQTRLLKQGDNLVAVAVPDPTGLNA